MHYVGGTLVVIAAFFGFFQTLSVMKSWIWAPLVGVAAAVIGGFIYNIVAKVMKWKVLSIREMFDFFLTWY